MFFNSSCDTTVAIGVSTRYVRKVLSEKRQDITEEKNRNSDPIFQKLKLLGRLEAALEELAALPEPERLTRLEKTLFKVIPTFLKTVRNNINETKVAIKKLK
ncbi:hypothetical protein NDA01_29925 [Trichocoleus desertorum AS-A10]|uniref:hypothetical protein n=1 Tax=Trichocoleus desertorum TaxID=1481672 RepID=UPI003296EAE6